MRSIGQSVEAKNYDGIATDAAALQEVFAEVGKFWRERDIEDALATCGATYQAAAAIETAANASAQPRRPEGLRHRINRNELRGRRDLSRNRGRGHHRPLLDRPDLVARDPIEVSDPNSSALAGTV